MSDSLSYSVSPNGRKEQRYKLETWLYTLTPAYFIDWTGSGIEGRQTF